ncbi:nuclear pore complex protein Nup88 isoform X2 [Hyposmocoma kahamanoa]|uniref:nuclear pore complex protein Nup88 isoform X2 n=1 Tax=Hyposmocoma kahamanoa TaxID=1477025 RepID=UPI000E6D8DDB|nr:nuclear pore complex protein Nup88 isoform X2 [Hyposmocoma kahamanoa]
MDPRLYEAKLINHNIFKELQGSLEDNPSGKLRNLIDLRDDVFYVWNSVENCLLSLNLKRLEERDGDTPYQKLHLLSPPAFQVERVVTSPCGSRICVWGSRGVTVAELPSRWGRGGLFDAGNQTVLCKSHSLDERFLYSQAEVRRVQWHPKSLSHLLVLVSDNTIRLYNIALKSGPKLVKIFTIGPKPSSTLAGRTILDSLGDTAVDFTACGAALLVLRGNGDVYMMHCDLDSKNPLQTKLTGPLAMYPPADDNYGTDSCSIVALGDTDGPALVVVATCSAQLYHCLLLPNSTDKEDGDTHALYVVETVELNIVLNTEELQHSYPVHLYACTNNTYVCVHAGGVHAMTLPIVRNLKDYALSDDAEPEARLSAVCGCASAARHLVCTSGSAAALRPPAGVCGSQPPLRHLLVLCDDGTALVRTLEPYDLEEQLYKELQLKNPALEKEDINNILKERQKLSFTAIVQEILTRDVSQPILKINKKDEPSPKESLEFVTQATLKLRGEYVARQLRARDAVLRKLRALAALGAQHAAWLGDLQKDVGDVKNQSTALKEKCALAEKHQDDIKYRCSAALRALLAELLTYKRQAERLQQQIRALKDHANDKSEELKKWQDEYKRKDIALGKSHSDTISSILQQQTSQISALIEETKLLKDQLSIV